MAALSPEQLALIQEILALARQSPPTFPAQPDFRVQHANQRPAIDELLKTRALVQQAGVYVPTLAGLRACGTDEARAAIRGCNALVDVLKGQVIRNPRKARWSVDEISEGSTLTEDDVKVFLTIVLASQEHHFSAGYGWEQSSPFIGHVMVNLDGMLDAQPVPETEPAPVPTTSGPGGVERIYVDNFRSFVNFEWSPP